MLKLKDSVKNVDFFKHNQIDDTVNHYRDVILPLMKKGDWDKVQRLEVIRLPSGESIEFGSDNWNLSKLEPEATSLVFTYNGQKLSYRLVNELKALVLARMYTGSRTIKLESIISDQRKLKNVILCLMESGVNSFSELSDAKYKQIAQANPLIFNKKDITRSINLLINYYDALPFNIQFTKQSQKKVGIRAKKEEPHLAIPPRIYSALVTQFSNDVSGVLRHLVQLETEIHRMFKIEQNFKIYLFKRLRRGEKINPFDTNPNKSNARLCKVIADFEEAGLSLIDNFQEEKRSPGLWMKKMENLAPPLAKSISCYSRKSSRFKFKPFQIGEHCFKTIGEFKTFLIELDFKSKSLCLLLSGMRVDELHSMHPNYGAQSYDYNGQTIHLFTTRQSKITKGTQTEEDMFVTNQMGHDAFRVLTTIHRPYLEKIADTKGRFFASIRKTMFPFTKSKSNWRGDLISNVNKWIGKHIGNALTHDDVSFLRTANPKNSGIELGATFLYENHQTRRSLAFYAIGLELMAFPQLKKQLSHLSSAMTRHYANNATYWGKLRTEIHRERVLQRSTLLASVYKRLATNGTIAGGKGKVLKKLAGNKNFFEQGLDDRRLDPSYWAKLIEAGKEHIHAIAPGMYCTNSQCDMRINVALDECVDCEFDLIMDGMYAEGRRLAAHRNLAVLDEMDDLNPSVASQLVLQIKSCEKILNDLEIAYKPITISKSVSQMLINTVST